MYNNKNWLWSPEHWKKEHLDILGKTRIRTKDLKGVQALKSTELSRPTNRC